MMRTLNPTILLPGLLALAVAACGAEANPVTVDPTGEATRAEARSADRCMNVELTLEHAPLGAWVFNGQPVGGGQPVPVTMGNVEGWLASILLGDPDAATKGNSGTAQWALTHIFFTSEPTVDVGTWPFPTPSVDLSQQTDWFMTDDRAVCADAGRGPFVCRVNDRMPIVEGTGIFQNAEGFLHNHGWITLTQPEIGVGYGEFQSRGRVCGDGVTG